MYVTYGETCQMQVGYSVILVKIKYIVLQTFMYQQTNKITLQYYTCTLFIFHKTYTAGLMTAWPLADTLIV